MGTASILIVEDDELNRTLLERRLSNNNYKVTVCGNGVDAISLSKEKKFDIILLDINLPDISGVEVLEKIKTNAETKKIKVVMVTANDDRETVLNCIEKGASDYLIKPFSMRIVNERIKRCLSKLTNTNTTNKNENNILLVDDQELNRDVLAHRLRKHGYNISCVSDGKQALTALNTDVFDLILLDILMPDMTGIEVLKKIRSSGQHKNTPVIMVTAIDNMETVNECMEYGADDYILKPLNTELLKIRISSCL